MMKDYKKYAEAHAPRSPVVKDTAAAFFSGGAVCAAAQGLNDLYTYFGEGAKGFYQYFVYPDQGILIGSLGSEFDGEYAFDPTGHLEKYYSGYIYNVQPDKQYRIGTTYREGYAHYQRGSDEKAWDAYYYGYNESDHNTLESIVKWFIVDRAYSSGTDERPLVSVDPKPTALPYTQ